MAGASDIRAGGAYFEVIGKDKLSPVLDSVGKKAKATDSLLKRLGKGAGGIAAGAGLGGLMGGPLGKIFGGAAAGAMFGPMGMAAGGAAGVFAAGIDLFKGGVKEHADTARMADRFGIGIELMSKLRRVAEDFGTTVEEVMGDTTGRFSEAIAKARGIDEDRARQAVEFENKMSEVSRNLQDALMPLLDIVVPVARAIADFTNELRELAGVAVGRAKLLDAATKPTKLDPKDLTRLQQLQALDLATTGVKGGFNAFNAAGQFGFGDANSEVKKQTELLKQLLAGQSVLPKEFGHEIKDVIRLK